MAKPPVANPNIPRVMLEEVPPLKTSRKLSTIDKEASTPLKINLIRKLRRRPTWMKVMLSATGPPTTIKPNIKATTSAKLCMW
jgi:hypothetical protein